MSSVTNTNNYGNQSTEEINQSYMAQIGRVAMCGAIQRYQWATSPAASAFCTGAHLYGVRDTLDELTFSDMKRKRQDAYTSQETFYGKIEDALDRLKTKDETKYAEVSAEYQEYRQYIEENSKQ